MSNDTNQESNEQKDSRDKKNETVAGGSLTFSDWKSLKEKEKSQQTKSNSKTKNATKNVKNKRDIRKNDGFNGSRVPFCQEAPNFFGNNNGPPGFVPPNFNGMNNFNNFRMQGNNNFGPINNGFNSLNGPSFNNFNRQNNFGGNNFNNGFNNSFGNDRNGFNGNKFDLPDTFFASDGIYRQKDLMQKPLPNPFRDEQRAEQLLKEFDTSRYTKEYKKKKKGNKTQADGRKNTSTKDKKLENNIDLNKEPEVYVANPKAKFDGKPFIPKPKVPEPNLEITKEEKKQQWKEYREAMKPFKNREFYNAKRVVQRLGKKDLSELDEKEITRLANAREIMAVHKARLSEKYPNYIKADDDSNGLGELYLLKKKHTDFEKLMPKHFQNYGNFGQSDSQNNYESGRKILGGYTEFQGFVSGGILDGTTPTL